jgi:hypothetical protein
MDIIRTLILDDIKMPVVVEHAHMDITDAGRVDKLSSRVDTLAVEVAIKYRGSALQTATHAGVFNYMTLYRSLCFSPVRHLTGPLETILDETMATVQTVAEQSGIALVAVTLTVQRLGLVVGAPQLKLIKIFAPEPQLPPGNYRSAGIAKVPLQVNVEHSWSQDDEHIALSNPFRETVQIEFSAVTPAAPLATDSLAGLYNYIPTYKLADSFQGTLVDGPFEGLAEKLLDHVRRDVAYLNPIMLSAKIVRSGYARCRPTLGVEWWLNHDNQCQGFCG